MIETTSKFFCDKCRREVYSGEKFYKISRNSVETQPAKDTRVATNAPVYHDGIVRFVGATYDEFVAFHTCQECTDDFFSDDNAIDCTKEDHGHHPEIDNVLFRKIKAACKSLPNYIQSMKISMSVNTPTEIDVEYYDGPMLKTETIRLFWKNKCK